MKMALFHFMNMLRLPIMFATKVLLWLMVFMMIMTWGGYFEWFSTPFEIKSESLTLAVGYTFIAVAAYYFRWQYDIILMRINPDGAIIAYAKSASVVASQNEIKS